MHSEADAAGLHVRCADEAICIGPTASAQSPVLRITNRLFPDYTLVLKRQNSTDSRLQCFDKAEQFSSLYAKCQPFFQQQGLNIINRQRFFGANYTQLHRREDKYYSLRNLRDMEEWRQSGTSLEFPDLRLLAGYKCTWCTPNSAW